jgi:hypothetical protein
MPMPQLPGSRTRSRQPTTPSDKLKSEYQAAVTTSTFTRIEADAYRTIVENQLEAGKNQSAGLTVIMEPQMLSTDKKPMLLGALLGGRSRCSGGEAPLSLGRLADASRQVPFSD